MLELGALVVQLWVFGLVRAAKVTIRGVGSHAGQKACNNKSDPCNLSTTESGFPVSACGKPIKLLINVLLKLENKCRHGV